MFKKFFLSFSILILSVAAKGETYLGVNAGMNITTLTTSESSAQFGFLAGVTLDIPISERFSFYPGITYSLNRIESSKHQKPAYSVHLSYLEVPTLISYKLGEAPTQFAIDLGPYFRYGLRGKSADSNHIGKYETFDEFKRFDVGGQIGARVLMNEVQIGFAFQYGLIKPTQLYKGNMYTFNLTLGYNFNIG